MARRKNPPRTDRSRRPALEAGTGTRRSAMSTTKGNPQTPPFAPMSEIGGKTLDAMSVLAEAGQRVGGQIVELWAAAAADRLRALGDIQAATVEAARAALSTTPPLEAFEEFRQDPTAWYARSLSTAFDNTQRALKLVETNVQILSRSAERFHGSAEKASKEIDSAVSACASRLRELYAIRA